MNRESRPLRLPTRGGSARRGVTLPDLLASLAVLAVVTALGVPALSGVFSQSMLREAARDVANVFNRARLRALDTGRDVGVKWLSSGGDVTFTLYEDRNGNGVLTADIRSGIDRPIGAPFSVRGRFPRATASFLTDFPGGDPAGGSPGSVGDLSDPIRFGRSDICSFSPMGHASPGSVWLSDGQGRQTVVRVSPMTAQIQIHDWCAPRRTWIKAY